MRLAVCEIEIMRSIFNAQMEMYQSKANLGEKMLFDEITHHLDPEIWKMLARGMFRNMFSTFHRGP